MTGGSLGIRSGSYGSLDKQLQNNNNSIINNNGVLPIQSARKPSKMLKEKERLFHSICKFAGRKKVGMLLLCVISAAVFGWVLYVGKQSYNITSLALPPPPPPPPFFLGYTLPPGHPCNTFTLPPPPADKKRTGPRPCPVCYLPVEEAIALMPKVPSYSPVLQNLTYIYEENLSRETEFGGSEFGGYPTLKQRSDSYDIRESMSVHCGFVRGSKPGRNTRYDMDEEDLHDMEQCHGVVVASAIFGNFDEINQPRNISDYSRETVCFYMFIDEETEAYLKSTGKLASSKKIGIWRTVVIHNPPYKDARRTGKIPKLLVHRMFPNARFSLWIDGKLELVVDPYQILERSSLYSTLFWCGNTMFSNVDKTHDTLWDFICFLWRKNATFAISRHYRRFDVFVEAEANKVAGKYDNASIDSQIEFYKKEGLTPYSEAKLPITSDVPEGCVIIREHVPISNLFTCLWRNFVVQKYHKDVLEHMAPRVPVAVLPPPLPPSLPPPALSNEPPAKAVEKRCPKGQDTESS
ncbi:hypothetical protein M0R45_013222 [Rubus argutus]|uniref:TOD1/MUCI70 glycosyltransferase-like domain-containing protein n=1 Tax=Rubus argutus TaxID=59490 RepID=A0AAW1XHN3_RUBAR